MNDFFFLQCVCLCVLVIWFKIDLRLDFITIKVLFPHSSSSSLLCSCCSVVDLLFGFLLGRNQKIWILAPAYLIIMFGCAWPIYSSYALYLYTFIRIPSEEVQFSMFLHRFKRAADVKWRIMDYLLAYPCTNFTVLVRKCVLCDDGYRHFQYSIFFVYV